VPVTRSSRVDRHSTIPRLIDLTPNLASSTSDFPTECTASRYEWRGHCLVATQREKASAYSHGLIARTVHATTTETPPSLVTAKPGLAYVVRPPESSTTCAIRLLAVSSPKRRLLACLRCCDHGLQPTFVGPGFGTDRFVPGHHRKAVAGSLNRSVRSTCCNFRPHLFFGFRPVVVFIFFWADSSTSCSFTVDAPCVCGSCRPVHRVARGRSLLRARYAMVRQPHGG